MNPDDMDFSTVVNRNEKKVRKALAEFMSQGRGAAYASTLTEKDYQDMYALALNRLPARYCQKGTIVVGDPVRDEDAMQAVMEAYEIVINRPKG